jgi:hypothetical protein
MRSISLAIAMRLLGAPRKLGLGPEDIVRDLVHQLGHDEPLPPQHTTHARVPPDPGELHRLRGEATEPSGPAACRWVCAPDCPEPCLQVVSWLIQSINNLVSQPPIRIGALGFDPGPRAPAAVGPAIADCAGPAELG